jgi:acetyl-CoA carboxylase biotin carboxylase subunit
LHYDSLLGKLIVWANDRAEAIARMLRALDELVLSGVATNQAFHRRLLADPEFQQGEIDIQFLERRPDLLQPVTSPDRALAVAIAAALAEDEARQSRRSVVMSQTTADGNWARQARADSLR